MAWKQGDDIGSWEVVTSEDEGGDYARLIEVILPSTIWISPASARKFAADLLKAAEDQERFNNRGLPDL